MNDQERTKTVSLKVTETEFALLNKAWKASPNDYSKSQFIRAAINDRAGFEVCAR